VSSDVSQSKIWQSTSEVSLVKFIFLRTADTPVHCSNRIQTTVAILGRDNCMGGLLGCRLQVSATRVQKKLLQDSFILLFIRPRGSCSSGASDFFSISSCLVPVMFSHTNPLCHQTIFLLTFHEVDHHQPFLASLYPLVIRLLIL